MELKLFVEIVSEQSQKCYLSVKNAHSLIKEESINGVSS